MPRVTDEYKAARVREIHRAVWKTIVEDGVDTFPIERILEESGFSVGKVYTYFASKDELILSAVESALQRLEATVQEALDTNPTSPPELFSAVYIAIERRGSVEPYVLGAAWGVLAHAAVSSSPKFAMEDYYLSLIHI